MAFFKTRRWRVALICVNILWLSASVSAQEPEAYKLIENISYRENGAGDAYSAERCKLDLYYPVGVKDYPTVVWFHGGGLTGGSKFIPQELKEQGIAVVAVNYRLSPKVKAPAYIEDAAAAIAWTFNHIGDYGGSKDLVFTAGHSAGGYLVAMTGLDKRWLQEFDIDANDIAGIINFSGHAITHMTVRKERRIPDTQPVVDSLAALFHVRADAPPLVIVSGDREMEMLGRYEESAYFYRMMKVAGHTETYLYELDGFDHGEMVRPGYRILLKHVWERQPD